MVTFRTCELTGSLVRHVNPNCHMWDMLPTGSPVRLANPTLSLLKVVNPTWSPVRELNFETCEHTGSHVRQVNPQGPCKTWTDMVHCETGEQQGLLYEKWTYRVQCESGRPTESLVREVNTRGLPWDKWAYMDTCETGDPTRSSVREVNLQGHMWIG